MIEDRTTGGRRRPSRAAAMAAGAGCAMIAAGSVPVLLGLGGAPIIARQLVDNHMPSTLDVANSFLPIWLVVIAAGVGLLLASRGGERWRRPALGVGLVSLIVAAAPIGWEVSHRAIVQPASGPALRLVQFNAFANNYDLNAAAQMVLRSRADVVAVEEPYKFVRLQPLLKAAYPYRTPCPADECAAILYSRKRPIATRLDNRIGTWYRVRNTPGNGPTEFARMDFAGHDGRPITIVAIHLVWPLPPAPFQHQLDVLAKYLTTVDRSRSILLGDFNLTPWSFAMRGMDRDLWPMTRVTRALFSWPAYLPDGPTTWPIPLLPIDHVFVGSDWRAVRVQRLARAGSDHFPVMVDLRLQERVSRRS